MCKLLRPVLAAHTILKIIVVQDRHLEGAACCSTQTQASRVVLDPQDLLRQMQTTDASTNGYRRGEYAIEPSP